MYTMRPLFIDHKHSPLSNVLFQCESGSAIIYNHSAPVVSAISFKLRARANIA